jgi:glycosyltransferase involved in cell wall biosynthesis
MKHRILVEGWRFFPHSYAIVNMFQLLALARREDVELYVADASIPFSHWRETRGLLSAADEAALAALPHGDPREAYDVHFHIGFPYEFRRSASKRTATFITSEFGGVPSAHFAGTPDFKALAKADDFVAITPSNWAAGACYARGLSQHSVAVVPHGVEPKIFHPDGEARAATRAKLNLNGFVFLNVGALTPNKGIETLLHAFGAVAQLRPEARLLLKGLDPLHNSRTRLRAEVAKLPAAIRQSVLEKTLYIGDSWSFEDMAALYRAADCYVSPYHAEGFNIPVLEAAASGLPLICTRGGPTEDFVTEYFCRKIESTRQNVSFEDVPGVQLMPKLDHLVKLMLPAIDDEAWRRAASSAAVTHTHTHFNWDAVASKLVDAFTA